MDEDKKLLIESREMYDRLRNIYKEDGMKLDMEIIKKMCSAVDLGARVFKKEQSPTYLSFIWYIPIEGRKDYDGENSLLLGYIEGDLNRFAEDLTMAYYKKIGGTKYTYTPDFIKLLMGL